MIPPHIIAEAISTLHGDGLDLRWSGPITPSEREYVQQYVLAKYPHYAGLVEGEKFDYTSICINEESPDVVTPDHKKKSLRGTGLRESPSPFSGSNLPDLDMTQLETSRLLNILTQKSSFPGSFISIPEVQARNKVLKHCGLPDDEYLVLFTPSYRDAKVLVAESYPFYSGITKWAIGILLMKNDNINISQQAASFLLTMSNDSPFYLRNPTCLYYMQDHRTSYDKETWKVSKMTILEITDLHVSLFLLSAPTI